MAKKGPTSGRDILLLLLYVPGATGEFNEPIRGRTRLMKFLFIFEREIWQAYRFDRSIEKVAMPEFYPWNFGPFSKDVFDDVEFFVRIGMIEVSGGGEQEATLEEAEEFAWWQSTTAVGESSEGEEYSDYTDEVFQLSDLGKGFIEDARLYESLSENQRAILSEYKRRFNDTPLYAILRYVYDKYPEMTDKSQIRDQVLC